jgi:hypothetical protein
VARLLELAAQRRLELLRSRAAVAREQHRPVVLHRVDDQLVRSARIAVADAGEQRVREHLIELDVPRRARRCLQALGGDAVDEIRRFRGVALRVELGDAARLLAAEVSGVQRQRVVEAADPTLDDGAAVLEGTNRDVDPGRERLVAGDPLVRVAHAAVDGHELIDRPLILDEAGDFRVVGADRRSCRCNRSGGASTRRARHDDGRARVDAVVGRVRELSADAHQVVAEVTGRRNRQGARGVVAAAVASNRLK